MKKFLLFLGVALATTLSVSEASAQIKIGENAGQVSVALESNSSFYAEDTTLENIGKMIAADRKAGDFGTHDYLKVDYNLDQFSAGIQAEGFLPPLYGYDLYKYTQQKGKKNLSFLGMYAQYEAQNWGIRIGDIYDQFGNGLIFRSFEDRALAFNNALFGVRAHYNLNNIVAVKTVAGKPRLYDERSDNWVYGADLSVSLSDMIGWYDGVFAIEGSYVTRHDADLGDLKFFDFENENVNMVSGRVNFEYSGFSLRGEYAAKLNEDFYHLSRGVDKGNALFLDLGYNYKRFSASASFRRTENMTTFIDPLSRDFGGGNVMNYIPLLTRQHTYSLANLNPYSGTMAMTGGEIGGQIDLYYSLRNPKVRGKYWNFHVNFSMFNSLDHDSPFYPTTIKGRNAWKDFNFDVERQWNKQLKTTFLYSMQTWDQYLTKQDGEDTHYCTSHIFVGDVTYKFNKKHSMRVEAQYLSSKNYEGDWVAGTIEYNFAPKYSFYVSDMWNCEPMKDGLYGNYFMNNKTGKSDHYLLHYYQIGASYTHNSLRVQLSYGRNREGYVCSGGVCRQQPAFTGANLALTYSF